MGDRRGRRPCDARAGAPSIAPTGPQGRIASERRAPWTRSRPGGTCASTRHRARRARAATRRRSPRRRPRLAAPLRGLGSHPSLRSGLRPLQLARGPRRTDELSTAEALDVIAQMAELGVERGHADRRRGLPARRLARRSCAPSATRGMRCTMVTGGRGFSRERAPSRHATRDCRACRCRSTAPRRAHDMLRGVRGSYDSALAAIAARAWGRHSGDGQHADRSGQRARCARALRSACRGGDRRVAGAAHGAHGARGRRAGARARAVPDDRGDADAGAAQGAR